jgi:hypothetical protein
MRTPFWLVALGLTACSVKLPNDTAGVGTEPTNTQTGTDPDGDGDGSPASEDCNDADGTVYPGAEEICDGQDNDCDEAIDEDGDTTFYIDADGDGWGDPSESVLACDLADGLSTNDADCDDSDASVYPEAPELCDGQDNDCDADVDEDPPTWYFDFDGDGYGTDDVTVESCDPGPDYALESGDCDDSQATVHPGAVEICDELDLDEDCNGLADDEDPDVDPAGMIELYDDVDLDSFGDDSTAAHLECDADADDADVQGDCNDADGSINPLAAERCNGVDDNCNGVTDDDPVDGTPYYADSDGDGFGDPDARLNSCAGAPAGHVDNSLDCDDADPAVGDCGAAVDHDGSYSGVLYATIEQADLGLADSCNIPFNSFTVDAGATPQIRGSADCTITFVFLGFPITETKTILLSGALDAEPYASGTLIIDAESAPWDGEFTAPGALYATFAGTFDAVGYEVSYDGYFSVTR